VKRNVFTVKVQDRGGNFHAEREQDDCASVGLLRQDRAREFRGTLIFRGRSSDQCIHLQAHLSSAGTAANSKA